MKPITKNIIFVVVALIIVIIITVSTQSPVVTPATGSTSAAHESTNPNSEMSGTVVSPTTYTLADVAKHKTPTDCWTSVNGGVYNLTPFVNQHPGGVVNITKLCGIEGTATFMAQHGGQAAPEKELASLKIGTLAK